MYLPWKLSVSFKYEILANQLWEDQLNTEIKKHLPENVQYELLSFDYYLFYNLLFLNN